MPVAAALWYQLVVTKSKCEGLIYKIRTQQRGTKVSGLVSGLQWGPIFLRNRAFFVWTSLQLFDSAPQSHFVKI